MRRLNTPYDVKTFILSLVGILALSMAMKATGGAAFALMIPIALMTLARNKPEHLVFILLLSISTILANGYIMPKGMVYGIAERGLFVGLGMILMTQVAGRRHPPFLTPLLGLLPYLFYMAIVSAWGWSPLISYLKLLLFVSIYIGYYAIAMRAMAAEMDVRKLRGMVLAIASFFIIGSVFAQRFGWAYMTFEELKGQVLDTNNLYMGMSNHSNALGGILAAYALILMADVLFSIQRLDWLYVLNFISAMYLIVRSGSRTAMGTVILGLCYAGYSFMQSRRVAKAWKNRVIRLGLLFVALGGFAVLISSSGREQIARFVTKTRNEDANVELTTENVMSSRQGKIDEGFYNWRRSPMVGNGFQVSEDMVGFQATSLASVLTAPVEKSVWFSAVLEEGGTYGFILFCLFLISVFVKLTKRRAYIGGTMLFALFCGNFGEFTFFSMSGGGGMQWGMVIVGLILDGQRLKEEQRRMMYPPWRPF